jgi:dolichol-phosphate mannosyltransferase
MARIAVVIPCFKVRDHILGVIAAIPADVENIYVVDDACPEASGAHVEANCNDPRVRVLRNAQNQGVGGATLRGYEAAIADGAQILVKLDGDGQMDPARIPSLVGPLLDGTADYTKGNRFFDLEDVRSMPLVRLVGNAILSFVNKVASGYWDVMDPTNGYTAINAVVAAALPLRKIARDYFFESDMLFRLSVLRAVVIDVPMAARYGNEVSNLRVSRVLLSFPGRYLGRAFKRLFYGYFLRDFNAGTVQLGLGLLLLGGGGIFGALRWQESIASGTPATAGTVVLAALPVLFGGHLLLSAINYDIANVPRRPVHPFLASALPPGRRA